MKILYVTTISDTVNAFLVPHIKLLIHQGHEVHIGCNVETDINPELVNMGCKLHHIEFQRNPIKKDNYRAYKKIKKLVLLEKYSLIHTHTPVASFLTRLSCRNISNLKVVYTTHGFHFFKGAPFKNWFIYYTMEKIAAKCTDAIITINSEDFNIAQKLKIRKSDNTYIIPGIGVNTHKFRCISQEQKSILRKKYGFKDEDFLLIYAAELNKNKNQRFLIEEMLLLKHRVPNIKLLFAGEGELKEVYINYAKKLNLDENIMFLGYRHDLHHLIPICDIGVSASLREGLGLNLIEEMSCGLPVIATNNRGHREIVQEGRNGFLFELNKDHEFVRLIEKLYMDDELRQKLGQNAVKSSKRFSIEKSLKAMEEIYMRC